MRDEYLIDVPPSIQKRPFKLTLLGITYEDPDYYIRRVDSPEIVIEYVMSGKGYIKRNGKESPVGPGDMYVLPLGDDHEYYSDPVNPYRKIWFNAEGPLFDELASLYGIRGKCIFHSLDGYDLLEKMLHLCEDKSLSGDEINTRASLILHEIVMRMSTHGTDEIDEDAEKLRIYLDMHITDQVSLKDLSEHIFKSESQTVRIFKKAFSITPYDYLLKAKISLSKRFLRNTTITIKDVAYRIGFNDEHYFSNVFRQKTGMSPSEYRRSNQ